MHGRDNDGLSLKYDCFVCEQRFSISDPLYKLQVNCENGEYLQKLICKPCGDVVLKMRYEESNDE